MVVNQTGLGKKESVLLRTVNRTPPGGWTWQASIKFITLSSTTWWTIVIGVKLKFYFFYFTNFIVIVFSIKKIQNNFSKLIIGPWIYQLDDIPLKRGEYVLHLKLFCALLNQSFFCIYCFLIFFLCSFLKT